MIFVTSDYGVAYVFLNIVIYSGLPTASRPQSWVFCNMKTRLLARIGRRDRSGRHTLHSRECSDERTTWLDMI